MFCSRATAIISLRRNKQGWLTFGAVQLVGCILAIYGTMYCSRGISETLNFAVRVFSRLSETVRDDSPAQLREALFSACGERFSLPWQTLRICAPSPVSRLDQDFSESAMEEVH